MGSHGDLTSGACIPFSNRVLLVRAPNGQVVDAVPFVQSDLTGTFRPGAYPADVQYLVDLGVWSDACDPSPCAYDTVPGVVGSSVGWKGVGTTPATESAQRKPNANTRTVADWNAPKAGSFGAPNP